MALVCYSRSTLFQCSNTHELFNYFIVQSLNLVRLFATPQSAAYHPPCLLLSPGVCPNSHLILAVVAVINWFVIKVLSEKHNHRIHVLTQTQIQRGLFQRISLCDFEGLTSPQSTRVGQQAGNLQARTNTFFSLTFFFLRRPQCFYHGLSTDQVRPIKTVKVN